MPISENYAAIKAVHEWTIEDYESELALLRRQRDELLEACKTAIDWMETDAVTQGLIPGGLVVWQALSEAISNCTPSPALDSGAGQTSGPAPDLGQGKHIGSRAVARHVRRLLRDAMLHGAYECWLETCKGNSYTDYIRPRLVALFPDVTDEPIPIPDDEGEIHTRLNETANGVDQ